MRIVDWNMRYRIEKVTTITQDGTVFDCVRVNDIGEDIGGEDGGGGYRFRVLVEDEWVEASVWKRHWIFFGVKFLFSRMLRLTSTYH